MTSSPFSRPNRLLPALLWFGTALCLFWIGNNNHSFWEADEPRYAVATREMIQSGDWIVPHFNGEIRFDKPVLIYWLMSIPARLLGPSEFSMRAIQGVGGALNVLLLFLLAGRMGISRGGQHLAAACGIGFTLLAVTSKAATTDSWLTLTVLAAMGCYWMQRQQAFSWVLHLAFWAILGFSMIHKGPVGPAFVLSAAGLDLLFRWKKGQLPADLPAWPLRLATGAAVFLAVSLPWAIAVNAATDGAFLRQSIGRHVIERAKSGLEGHTGPIFYYVLALPLVVFPLAGPALLAMAWGWKHRSRELERFLLCWFIPGFIIISLNTTKLPHYLAPLLPALALLAGRWWTERGAFACRTERTWRRIGAGLTGLVAVGAALALPIAAGVLDVPFLLPAVITVAAMLLATWGTAAIFWWKGENERPVLLLLGGQAGFILLVMLWVLPVLQPHRPSPAIGRWLAENAPPGTRVAASEFNDSTLVYYAGGPEPVLFVGKDERGFNEAMAEWKRPGPHAFITTAGRWQKWEEKYDAPRPQDLRVLYRERLFHATEGGWNEFLVIGNW